MGEATRKLNTGISIRLLEKLSEPLGLNDGRDLQAWTYVWQLGEVNGGMVLIEHRNKQYRIPARHLVEAPVPAPSTERLAMLDPCFPKLKDARLEEIYFNESSMFAVYRCPHGNYFMEDVRGGIAMHSRWLFLGRVDDLSEARWRSLWVKYHDLSSDALYYQGIAC